MENVPHPLLKVYCHVFTRLNETCLITDCIDERDEHDEESHPLRKNRKHENMQGQTINDNHDHGGTL